MCQGGVPRHCNHQSSYVKVNYNPPTGRLKDPGDVSKSTSFTTAWVRRNSPRILSSGDAYAGSVWRKAYKTGPKDLAKDFTTLEDYYEEVGIQSE